MKDSVARNAILRYASVTRVYGREKEAARPLAAARQSLRAYVSQVLWQQVLSWYAVRHGA